uniref:Nuclear protein 1 n=1 Tax=Amphimedon queenslandica TaxID=400682 RepID=A0A1X7VUV4_AMPQE
MDHIYFDEYDYFNFGSGFDKMFPDNKNTGHSKHKGYKLETQRYSPSGHVRKVVTKLQNSEKKKKEKRLRLSSI